jgi:hypothetical protein
MNAQEDEDPDNPGWTAEDFRRARAAAEVLPPAIARQLVRPQERMPISLTSAVRAAGPGLIEASIAPFRLNRAA